MTKVFIPNKGVLYYKIDDYNLKSIMELHFKYFFIRIRDITKYTNKRKIKLNLSSEYSLNQFSCELIPLTNSFLLE